MSQRVSRKRRQSWESLVKLMNEAKTKKRESSVDTSVDTSIEPVEQPRESADTEDLELLPAPTERVNDTFSDASSIDDEDYEETIEEDDNSALYEDWIDELDREDIQMMAMMMYDYFVKQFKYMKTRAAEEVSRCLGISDRTVRSWRKIFLSNHRCFEERRGKYTRYDALDDEEYKDMALEWVRSNAYVKGKPNMTAADFCAWFNSDLLPKVLNNHPSAPSNISIRTARRWLHKLGFEQVSSKKGIYIDGHERADVVEYRKLYLKRLDILAKSIYHHLCVVMSLLAMHHHLALMNLLHTGSLCLFFMMRASFIQMMTKAGCGVRKVRPY